MIRYQEVEVSEAQRQRESRENSPDRHAARALVVSLDVRAGVRAGIDLVVQFGLLGVGDHPTVQFDAEVDVGLGQRGHAVRRLRRNVRHHEDGVTGRGVDLIRGNHGRANAVRVLQVLVDPTVRRQVGAIELASADKDWRQFPVDEIAVY